MSKATKQSLKAHFKENIVDTMSKEQGINPMRVPRLEKVVVNIGCKYDKKQIEAAKEELTKITGQMAVTTYTVNPVAGWKIRKGWPIGTKVTLRGEKMYAFVQKLITVVLPAVRDFSGLKSKSFDGQGNYSFGLSDQSVFPDLAYEDVDQIRGMDITFVTSSSDDALALAMLKHLGLPFRKTREGV